MAEGTRASLTVVVFLLAVIIGARFWDFPGNLVVGALAAGATWLITRPKERDKP
jgi:hypothetical protein